MTKDVCVHNDSFAGSPLAHSGYLITTSKLVKSDKTVFEQNLNEDT